MALLKGVEATVLLHLRRGASLEARDDLGRTPLMLAAAAGRMITCQLLLDEGAGRWDTDHDGLTAAELASRAGFDEIARAIGGAAPAAPAPISDEAWEGAASLFTGAWEAEDEVLVGAPDLAMVAGPSAVQGAISAHRVKRTPDGWATADIAIPRTGARRVVRLPAGSRRLFHDALHRGWTTPARIAGAIPRLSGEMRGLVRRALDQSGVRLDRDSPMTAGIDIDATSTGLPHNDPTVEQALALLASLIDDAAADTGTRYASEIARLALSGRDEEARMFRQFGEARSELLATLRAHRAEYLDWLGAGQQSNAPAMDGEEDEDEPNGSDETIAFEDETARNLLSSDGVNADDLSWASLVRLMGSAPQDALGGTAATGLGRALSKFKRSRDRVATANLRLVPWVARRYRDRLLAEEDLVQEGNIGLLRAIDRFDPDRGNRFSTYAVWWIRQAITRAIDDQARMVRIPVHACETLRRVERFETAWLARTGAEPSPSDIATTLEIEPKIVSRLSGVLQQQLDPVETAEVLAGLEDGTDGNPYAALFDAQRRSLCSQALRILDPRQERVVRLRFGLAGAPERTLEDVGTAFEVTRERIRQIEAKALGRLAFPGRAKALKDLLYA